MVTTGRRWSDIELGKLRRATTAASSPYGIGGRPKTGLLTPKPVTLPRLAFLEDDDPAPGGLGSANDGND